MAQKPDEDYLLATLQSLGEESLERIFRMLALIYESDMIHVVYDRLTDFEQDADIKANALELLDNVLEAELFRAVAPLFDEGQSRGALEDFHRSVLLEDFLKGQDRWLAVVSIFLIIALEVKELYPLIEAVKHSSVPIVREAAEIATIKTGQRS